MADNDYDIGIIGGGAAGLTVASGTAQLGAKTWVIATGSSAAVPSILGLNEIDKRVTGNVFSPKIFSHKVQKGLKFFFNRFRCRFLP